MTIHSIQDLHSQVDGLLDVEGNFHYLREAVVVTHAEYELMLEEAVMDCFQGTDPIDIKDGKVTIREAEFRAVRFQEIDINTILGTGAKL